MKMEFKDESEKELLRMLLIDASVNSEILNDSEKDKAIRMYYRLRGDEDTMCEEENQVTEKRFGAGDVVRYWRNDSITKTGRIEKINYENDWVEISNCTVMLKISDIQRQATPEEVKGLKDFEWWHKRGRIPWELKEGDTLISKNDPHTCDVKFVEASDTSGTLLANGIKDEYIDDISVLKEKYEIFCFVEDRKDKRIKHAF